ncbi:MAG: oxidoreductase [Acidobacteriia bacterium]|nr:oxidoreductase [Terriglobia bacterium]
MPPIPVGLVGYGSAGATFHAPLIRSVPQLRLQSVVTSRAEQVAQLGGRRAVSSVAEALADPEIQLVVIASPSATHFEGARQALEAGKHVVVDKPFALKVSEADELIALAKKKGRALSVFQNRRWDGDYLTVKRLIREGLLGTVYHYEAHYDRYRPEIRQRWREQPGPGSGMLYDLGPHLVDQALQLFGKPDAVMADAFGQRPGSETIDYFHIVLQYGARRAILHASMLAPAPGPHFTVHGDRGSFTKFGMDPQEDFLKAGKGPRDPGWGVDTRDGELALADGSRRSVATERGSYETFYVRMAEHIAGRGPAPVDPADARDGLKVIEEVIRRSQPFWPPG